MFIKRIIEFFKSKFANVNLDFIEEGDIIFIKRYENRKEKKMLKGHETGPAVIVKKEDQNIYYLSCSGNEKKKELPINRPLLSKDDYPELSENTYVIPIELKTLKPGMFIRKSTILRHQDMEHIYRALLLQKEYHPDYLPSDIDFDYQYSVGDIIRYDFSRYYIMGLDSDNFKALKIYSNVGAKDKKKLLINYRLYAIDYSQIYTIPINSDKALIDHASENMQGLINSNYLEFKKQERQQNLEQIQLDRGMLIDIDDSLYYVYGQEKEDYLLYIVYPYMENQSGYKISINNNEFLTFFGEHIINKDESNNAKVIDIATDDEAKEIKKLRKFSKRQDKNLPESIGPQLYKGFQTRCVIADEYGREYVIIYRFKNTIHFVALDDLNFCYEYTIKNSQPFNFFFLKRMSEPEFKKIVDSHYYSAQFRKKLRN